MNLGNSDRSDEKKLILPCEVLYDEPDQLTLLSNRSKRDSVMHMILAQTDVKGYKFRNRKTTKSAKHKREDDEHCQMPYPAGMAIKQKGRHGVRKRCKHACQYRRYQKALHTEAKCLIVENETCIGRDEYFVEAVHGKRRSPDNGRLEYDVQWWKWERKEPDWTPLSYISMVHYKDNHVVIYECNVKKLHLEELRVNLVLSMKGDWTSGNPELIMCKVNFIQLAKKVQTWETLKTVVNDLNGIPRNFENCIKRIKRKAVKKQINDLIDQLVKERTVRRQAKILHPNMDL